MKKMVLVLLVFAVVTGSAFAFDILSFPAPVQGNAIMIDAGLGLWYVGAGSLTAISIPPLFLQGEYALPVGVPISVGVGINFARWKWGLWGWTWSETHIAPHIRGNWHWGFDIPWLDFYTGISLGADIVSVKWTSEYDDWLGGWGLGSYARPSTTGSGFYWAFQAGAHFYFSKNVGVVVETGYPMWIKAGLALKFGGSGAPKQASRSSSSSQSSGDYMLVNADSLNVRKGPSADHEAVGVVARNARVEVLERSGQWWKIRYGNIEGYVNSSYLSSEGR